MKGISRISTVLATSAALTLPALAQRGPLAGFNPSTPYLIHYGNWTPTLIDQARTGYRLVILHPSTSNITPANIASIRSGPDLTPGTSDDVKVLAYISVGEDDRPGAPFAGDGNGPRVDPRPTYDSPLSDDIAPLGDASPGGSGYASYYLDDNDFNGLPDRNNIFGGYYVNPGDPAWYEILKTKTKAADGRCGIQELLTTTFGAGYGCDGLFLDTLDTPAPNSFGATFFEWTAKAYRDLVRQISDDNPTKILLANRGVFFYNPNLKPYAYTLRPYINLLMFESYYTDSSGTGLPSAFFDDNRFNFAPKINAEAGRPDGFGVIGLGYTTPGEPPALGTADFEACQRDQGWALYRTNPALEALPFSTAAATWNAANPDSSPPVWDSTAATAADSDPGTPGNQAPAPRIGVQEAVAADASVTLRWDVARDQTGPVKYHVYHTTAATLDFATATKISNVAPGIPENYRTGTGASKYPYEFTVTGLPNGVLHRFAIRAEDALGNEDSNTTVLSATPFGAPSYYKTIAIDGNDADWADVPVLFTDPSGEGIPDIASIQVANDEEYLYLLVRYHGSADTNGFNSSPSLFLSVDHDDDTATGFNIYGLGEVGADVTWQNDFPFAQSASSFNLGATFSSAAAISPYATNTSFQEYRLRRDATFNTGGPATPVFPENTLRLAFWSDSGTQAEFAGGIDYAFASAPPVPGHFTHIRIDGDFSDWQDVPTLGTDPATDGTPDIVSMKVANDENYLYVLIGYQGPTLVNTAGGSASTFLSIDTDANAATGFDVYGLGEIGADVSWQNDFPFAQSAGNFNVGATFTNAAAIISPYAVETQWQEYRIRRDATFSLSSISSGLFPQSLIRLAAWTDGPSAEFAGGYDYQFSTNPGSNSYEAWQLAHFTSTERAAPLISGPEADPDSDGLANLLEFAMGGNPWSQDADILPDHEVITLGADRYLSLSYQRRTDLGPVTLAPESSGDLQLWDDSPAQFTTISTTLVSAGIERVVIRFSQPIPACPPFLRLKATSAP
ncbi:MAG: hypothetical protein MUF31_14250 [Akkermansiaceae bacterium]|jgi:hypothetical protein|nr:hypothetical protein [Akkermansiaceae bacterium]